MGEVKIGLELTQVEHKVGPYNPPKDMDTKELIAMLGAPPVTGICCDSLYFLMEG